MVASCVGLLGFPGTWNELVYKLGCGEAPGVVVLGGVG